MADGTGIEWTDATWNPLRGCTRVSEGCRNCYAETVAARFSGPGQPYEGLAKWVDRPGEKREARWTGMVALIKEALDQPLRWKRPRRILVNSMSDLFHESVPDEWIDRIFAVMALAPQHTFQVLTKRPERMREYLLARNGMGNPMLCRAINAIERDLGNRHGALEMPLPNVWLGVSVEDQATADARIPILLDTPAAVRWISAEPLLGAVNLRSLDNERDRGWEQPMDALTAYSNEQAIEEWGEEDARGCPALDWVVVGGESGPGARAMHPAWARSIRDQCAAADVPFLFKQWGEWAPSTEEQAAGNPRSGWVALSGRRPARAEELYAEAGAAFVEHVGKKAAGRLLDGVVHDGYPQGTP